MAQEIINIGAVPNDGEGDPLRTAFNKCNENFTALFAGAGAGGNTWATLGQKTGEFGPISIGLGQYATDVPQGNLSIAIGAYAGSGTIATADYVSGNGNPTMTVSDTFTIPIGSVVSGNGFTYGQRVTGITSYGTPGDITLSAPPDGTPSGTLTFNGGQGTEAVALGAGAGQTNQFDGAVAVGYNAGQNGQGYSAIAIGYNAAPYQQGESAIAIGWQAGGTETSQTVGEISIGAATGGAGGNMAIAIGYFAGSGADNSILLNATGTPIYAGNAGLFVTPVREDPIYTSNVMTYNYSTNELTYANTISLSGNVTGNYIFGNGSQLTGLTTTSTSIVNGTSNVRVVTAGGNVTTSIGGTANVVVTASTGQYVSGLINVSGLITATGLISAVGNVSGGNIRTFGTMSALGNVTGGNVITAGIISATGNINGGGNITLSTATGNINAHDITLGGNVRTTALISATGNITGANIIGTNFIGDTVNLGTGDVNAGNVFFALNSSRFTSASWILVETINANLSLGNQTVSTTNNFDYYQNNYNEVLCISSSGGNIGGTIVIPVEAVTANSVWNINQQIGFNWANLSNANVEVVAVGTGPYTLVSFTMYAR